jgi:hypothetical protein
MDGVTEYWEQAAYRVVGQYDRRTLQAATDLLEAFADRTAVARLRGERCNAIVHGQFTPDRCSFSTPNRRKGARTSWLWPMNSAACAAFTAGPTQRGRTGLLFSNLAGPSALTHSGRTSHLPDPTMPERPGPDPEPRADRPCLPEVAQGLSIGSRPSIGRVGSVTS